MDLTRNLRYPKPKADMAKGSYMSGADVTEVQKLLVSAGYSVGKSGVDGCYGPDTKAAVIAFQQGHKDENGRPLEVDGVVGSHTWWSLHHIVPAQPAGPKATAFCAHAASKVGCLYVSGGQGQQGTPELIRKLEKDNGNYQRALAQYNLHVQKGLPLTIYDCSGLVMEYLQNEQHLVATDKTANGIYFDLCTPIDRQGLRAGDLVFIKDTKGPLHLHHVGICMGDGTVVQAKGRDYGVVRTLIGTDGWTNYGRLKCLE
jgi:cell wall-associated NlpC family hydrolase